MKKSVLVLMGLAFVSSAQAYTLNLESNAVFANRKCVLELGEKEYIENRELMVQDAVITTKAKKYSFTLSEEKRFSNQTEFGTLNGEIIPTSVHITKISEEAISVKAIAEDWHGRTDLVFDCGVMVAK